MKKILTTIISMSLLAVAVISSNNMFNQQDLNSESVAAATLSFQNSGDMQKSSNIATSYASLNDEAKCGQYSSYSCSSSCSTTCTGCCSHKCSQRCNPF